MRTPAEGRSTLTDPARPGSRMWREGRGGRLRLSVEWPQDSGGVNLARRRAASMLARVSRGIVTLAYGARHRRFAAVLARSLELHCPDIPRAIVTDAVDERLARL